MKLKALALATATLALAACGKTLLWKTSITDASLTGVPLALVTDSSNASYQLYPVGTALQLRKLDANGVQQWTVPVDGSVVDASGASALRATSTGVAVGYGTATTAAYVASFDANGVALWRSDLGTHTAESIADMVVGSDDSVTVSIKLAAGRSNTLRLDANGAIAWDKTLPNCTLNLFCAPSLALNSDGLLLQTLAEGTGTKSYLIDSAGNTLWSKTRSTGISLSGVSANPITPTANGFVVTHAFTTWEYDLSGNLRWSTAYGGTTAVALDATTGTLFVPNGNKITKLDANGTFVSEQELLNQQVISQLEWKNSIQRLVVLSQYVTQTSVIIGQVSATAGASLWIFDATGKQVAKYNGTTTTTTGTDCNPFPTCNTVATTYGDQWSKFATTSNRMVVLSGMVQNAERYATAYNIK